MAILNVPGAYASIAEAVAAARSGDTIAVAAGYRGHETVAGIKGGLVFDAPADVPGIVLKLPYADTRITLAGAAPIKVVAGNGDQVIIGNAGANDLSAELGSVTIDGGGGDDTITTYSDGKDRLSGGLGNDRFVVGSFDGFPGRGGTVDGGAGIDTIVTDALAGLKLSSVEILDTASVSATLEQLGAFRTITDSRKAGERMTLDLRGSGGVFDASKRIGDGHSVELDGSALGSALRTTGTARADHLIGSEYGDRLNGGAGDDVISGGFHSTKPGVDILKGNDGNDTFRLDLDASARGLVDGGAGRDTVVSGDLGRYAFGNVEILDIGTAGGLFATPKQLASFDRIGDSNGHHTRIDVELRSGAAAVDFTKLLSDGDSVSIVDAGLTSGLIVKGSLYDDFLIGTRFSDTIDGGAGDDRIDLFAQAADGRTLETPGGNDRLKGGAGDDTFLLHHGGRGTVDGGTGIDTVQASEFHGFTFRNVEVLDAISPDGTIAQLSSFKTIESTQYPHVELPIFLRGKGGSIDFSHRIGEHNTIAVDASTVSSGVTVKGSTRDDFLGGSNFADKLDGGGGNDRIYGGEGGADILKGGAGLDTFAFNEASSRGAVDHIVDFTPLGSGAPDTLRLAHSLVPDLSSGFLADGAFKDLGVAGAREDADDRILYDRTTGAVSYDVDGSGGAVAVQFAVLDNHALLSARDILVV